MHAKKSSNANMRFLFGSVFFFAVILLTIVLFIYFAMQEAWKKSPDTSYTYTITFAHELEGKNYSVYLDDSLLYTGNPIAADTNQSDTIHDGRKGKYRRYRYCDKNPTFHSDVIAIRCGP